MPKCQIFCSNLGPGVDRREGLAVCWSLNGHYRVHGHGTLQARFVRQVSTVCPRSSDPSYAVNWFIKWITTSWTYSTSLSFVFLIDNKHSAMYCLSNKSWPDWYKTLYINGPRIFGQTVEFFFCVKYFFLIARLWIRPNHEPLCIWIYQAIIY